MLQLLSLRPSSRASGNCVVPILSIAERPFDRELFPIFIDDNQKKLRLRHFAFRPPLFDSLTRETVGRRARWVCAPRSSSGSAQRPLASIPQMFHVCWNSKRHTASILARSPIFSIQFPLGEYIKMLAVWTLAVVSGSKRTRQLSMVARCARAT